MSEARKNAFSKKHASPSKNLIVFTVTYI